MKRLIIYTGIFCGLVVFNSSCKKYVTIDPPRTSLSADLVFTDDKTADAAVVGIYANMNSYTSSLMNTNGNFYPSFSADDFKPYTSSPASDEFTENGLTSGNGVISSLWSEPYSLIFHANAIIEGVAKSRTLSAVKAAQFTGEARFMRAYLYFYLINYFGDVPLILNTNFLVNTSLPRTSATIIYDTIIKDLQAAQLGLSDNYLSSERVRVNRGAANALLARVYLYRSQWDKAEAEATKVIGDAKYTLLANLNSVFLRTSQEAIWQLQAVNTVTASGGINTWEGYSIVPGSATAAPAYIMYPNFITGFETGDKRSASWLKSYTPATGPVVYYPYKYKVASGTPVTEYSTVMRVAEQYLIRAEARTQQNNLTGAKSDVDSIRKRAGLPLLAAGLTKDQTLLAIEQERKVELFTEWGHRWFDLRRTGRSIAVLGPLKAGLTTDDLYYPLPLDALITNLNLTQNKGYVK